MIISPMDKMPDRQRNLMLGDGPDITLEKPGLPNLPRLDGGDDRNEAVVNTVVHIVRAKLSPKETLYAVGEKTTVQLLHGTIISIHYAGG